MALTQSSEALSPHPHDSSRRLEVLPVLDELTPLDLVRSHVPGQLKWVLDRVLAAVLLVALLPFFVALSVAIWLSDGGSPFYRQERVATLGAASRTWRSRRCTPARPRRGPRSRPPNAAPARCRSSFAAAPRAPPPA